LNNDLFPHMSAQGSAAVFWRKDSPFALQVVAPTGGSVLDLVEPKAAVVSQEFDPLTLTDRVLFEAPLESANEYDLYTIPLDGVDSVPRPCKALSRGHGRPVQAPGLPLTRRISLVPKPRNPSPHSTL
jgi:hypothetical protein